MLDPTQDEDGDGLVDEDPIDNPPFDDDGDGTADEDPPGTLSIITPDMYADVSHDSEGYIYVWQETSGVFPVAIEAIGTQEKRHWWWSKSIPLGRRINNDGTFGTTAQSLGAQKFRPFVTSGGGAGDLDDAETLVGDLESLYNGKFNFEYVPLDMIPRVTSLIWPGPDGIMYTADDGDGQSDDGSLITWSLNSLVFNVPKSRIRARHVPEGSDPTGLDTIVFDVFNQTGVFAVRPTVTWGLSQQPDDPSTPSINETFTTSIYAVAWQDVQEIAWQGDVRAVELFGNIELRLVEEYGYPSGAQINVSTLSATDKYLWPTVTFAYESEQLYVGYTRTDGTLFNPVTHMRAYFPKGFTFLDFENIMSPIATLHPTAIAQSHNPVSVDPGNPDIANHHVMASGVEDDFSATYVRRYKFASTPTVGFPKLFVISSETSATGENPDSDPAPPQLNLNFSTTASSIAPADQILLIGNVGGTLSKLNWTATATQSWVEINGATIATGGPLDPNTTEAVTVSVIPTFLTDGNYTAIIDLTSPLATNSPLTVIVNLQIGTGVPPGTPGLTASPTPITVTGPIGGPSPPPTIFNISFIESAPGELADWNLSLSSITPAGSAWVFVDPIFLGPLPIDSEGTSAGAGQTDGTSVSITLSFDLADLVLIGAGPGSYTATLALVSPSTTGADMVTVNTPTITINLTATGPSGELCSNGIDDDGDGDIDCADSECASDPSCVTGGGEICTDGFDNDGDGDVDCADADCATDPSCCAAGGGGGSGNTRGGGGASGFLPGCSSEAGTSQHGGTSSAVLALILAVILGLAVRRLA